MSAAVEPIDPLACHLVIEHWIAIGAVVLGLVGIYPANQSHCTVRGANALCDEKGRPCVLLLTPGNVHDCKVAQLCIEAMPPSAELVADKGYDSQALREWLVERGTKPVIPPRKNRKIQYGYDRAIYKQRNVVERMFCRFKDWRRIATRFDRNIKNFMAAISLAAAVIWWL